VWSEDSSACAAVCRDFDNPQILQILLTLAKKLISGENEEHED